ncbi:hypothetical protein BXZ70DRAFT_692614 [Cristinia sonorae]|uniref:SnoaL-like domain-containing protein n=1 Tax=Cristinia sonorae TaxID=1940300 RepID=A0A8K0UEB0_9AGAR|nr:hypothetical protein BXZ70DRAFT_692614 [Cristinia sonorae]
MPVSFPPSIVSSPSPQMKLVLDWFDAVNRVDFAALSGFVTKDYSQTLYPESLHRLPKEVTAGHEIGKLYSELVPKMETFEITVYDVVEGLNGKIVVHFSGDVQMSFGYRYLNEYMFTFEVVEQADGSFKLSKVKEFADTKATVDLLEAARKLKGIPLFSDTN